MELSVNVNPEQINQAVADAIIKSAIGKELERVINEEVKKLSSSYNNPIEGLVANHIRGAISALLTEKYADQIRAVVEQKMTEKFTSDFVEKLWSNFARNF